MEDQSKSEIGQDSPQSQSRFSDESNESQFSDSHNPPIDQEDEYGSHIHQNWTPDSKQSLALVVRGTPERYDLHFLIILIIDLRSDRENLRDIIPIANRDREFIYKFDLNKSPEVLVKILKNEIQREESRSSTRDSRLVEEKFRTLFNKLMRGASLKRQLLENDQDSIRRFLRKKLSDDCFPGTNIEIEIVLSPWEPLSSEGNSEEKTKSIEESDHDLQVSPVVHPMRGEAIGRLQPGDVFLIRVTGDSVDKINEEYLSESQGNVYSKPIKARLIRMEEGDTPQEISFSVEIDDNYTGHGMVPREVRVQSNEQLIHMNEPLSYQILKVFLLVASIFFFLSLGTFLFIS